MNELTRRGQFQPGESGNPAGKPPNTRNILTQSLIEDLAAEWQTGGRDALKSLRVEKPDKFVLAAMSILPRDVLVQISHEPTGMQAVLEALSPDQKRSLAEVLHLIDVIGDARALELLRSEAAKVVGPGQ
jgi:hypothetical protein